MANVIHLLKLLVLFENVNFKVLVLVGDKSELRHQGRRVRLLVVITKLGYKIILIEILTLLVVRVLLVLLANIIQYWHVTHVHLYQGDQMKIFKNCLK